jgi:hypothetical protein
MYRRSCALAVSALLLPALTACGNNSSSGETVETSASPTRVELAGASVRTMAAGSARFTLAVSGSVAGMSIGSQEQGTVSFKRRIAHLYRLLPGNGVPQEMIIVAPIVYTNANVVAALSDPSVRPWTRLDTRRLPSARKGVSDDIDHIRTLAYLAEGVVDARRLGPARASSPGVTHIRGLVEPARVVAHVPAEERKAIHEVIASDYIDHSFPADFWLDMHGRVVRVLVVYRTQGGGTIRVAGGFSGFGAKVALKLPPAAEIQDITP